MLGTVHGDTFTEEAVLDTPAAESIGDHIEHFVTTARSEDIDYTLSQQALALLIAKRIADAGAMPKGQASAYLLRDVFSISRQDTATILGVTPSTVDTQRTAGREKADLAALLTRGLDEIKDRY
jgi:DNA-directed RNA polymerase specialized sigma24 family protein